MDESIRIPVIVEGGNSFVFFDELEKDAHEAAAAVATISQPVADLKQRFDDMGRSARRSGEGLHGLENASRGPGQAMNTLTTSTAKASATLSKLPNTSNQATFALTNLSRVAQDMPYGFLGIANNLNPLLESFQRLKATTGSTSGALLAMRQSLSGAGGIGLALGVVSSLLITFGDKLFSSTQGINTTDVAINSFKNSIKDLADEIDNLKERMDFTAQIRKLQLTLTHGAGAITNILGLKGDSGDAEKFIEKIDRRITALGNTVVRFTPQLQEFSKGIENIPNKFLTKGQILLKLYGDINKIPEDAVAKLGKSERKFINEFQETSKELEDLEKKKSDALQLIRANSFKIQQEQKDDEKRLNELAAKDYDQYVSEIIAKAKEYSNFYKDAIDVQLEITPFDGKAEVFKKSLEFFNTINSGNFFFKTVRVKVPISPEIEFDQKEIQRILLGGGHILDFKEQVQENLNKSLEGLVVKPHFNIDPQVAINNKQMLDELKQNLSDFMPIADGIGDAFTSAFDAIAKGENVFEAFGESLKQLMIDLIKTAIKAFIIKQIMNLIVPGSGSVASGAGGLGSLLSGIPHFASGGSASAATLAVIGEGRGTSRNNPEFVNTGDQLKSFFGSMMHDVMSGSSGGSQMQQIGSSISIPQTVALRFDGNDLVGTMVLVQERQRRGG